MEVDASGARALKVLEETMSPAAETNEPRGRKNIYILMSNL